MNYSKNQFGVKAAKEFSLEIKKNNILLLQNPNMGAIEQLLHYLLVTVRYPVVDNYKEFYYVKDDEIRILRLWHCAQNPVRLYSYFNANPQILCDPLEEYQRTPKSPQTPDNSFEQ